MTNTVTLERLIGCVTGAYNRIMIISFIRTISILFLIVELSSDNADFCQPLNFLYLLMAVVAHYLCKDYFGFDPMSYKKIQCVNEFVPFKKWMVRFSDEELTKYEYEAFMYDELVSTEGRLKLNKLNEVGRVTFYDVANFLLFEKQYGLPKDAREHNKAGMK